MTSGLHWRLLGIALLSVLFASPLLADVVIVTPPALPGGTINNLYTVSLAATGCGSSCEWSLTSGSALPPGLSLGTLNGVIGGNATASGTFNFTIEANGSGNKSDQRSFSLTIAPAISITTPFLSGATVNADYSQTLSRTGGTAPFTWSIAPGTLPVGITLSPNTGVISGTPGTAGLFNITVRVTDSANFNGATTTKPLSILVSPALVISTASFPGGVIGSPYSQSIAVTGGTAPFNWSLAAGALPPGLGLNSNSGLISGTPTSSGTFGFTILGIDSFGATASKALSIAVAVPLSFVGNSLPAATASTFYTTPVSVTGGTAPFTWSVAAGAIPAGLSLNPSTGVISGSPSPSAAGTANLTIQVVDSGIPAQSISQPLSIVIAPPLVLTTSAFAGGTLGIPYSAAAAKTGGTAPFTWSITAGALPSGLTLAAGTGIISGTPAATGTAGFTLRVQDSLGAADSKPLSIAIAAVPVITTAFLQSATVNAAYAQTMLNTGGTSPLAWSLASGFFPTGLTVSEATGVISGTPLSAGLFIFTMRVTDNVGATTVSGNISINVAPALSVSTPPLPGSTVGAIYSTTLTRGGGTAPFAWSVAAGQLPAGLTLNSSTGAITGTPSTAGTANFTAQVSDIVGATASAPFSIVVAPAPVITTSSLPGGVTGSPYSQNIATSGGTAPIVWSIATGALPAGLNLNPSTGAITGTPTINGSFGFSIQGIDQFGATASKPLSIAVALPLSTVNSLPPGTASSIYSATAAVTGGTSPFTWSIATGTLPSGLSLNPNTGVISGTPSPSAAGTANFTIQVSDSGFPAQSVSQPLSITIAPPLVLTTTSFAGGTVGILYSAAAANTGGTVPFTWSISAGALPAGLSLNPNTGLISGTPTATGIAAFTVLVVDSAGATAAKPLTIAIAAAPVITTAALQGATANTAYSQTLLNSGGTSPFTWSLASGSLPPGLTLSPTTGVIGGTPSSGGVFGVVVRITDNVGATAVSDNLSITVAAALSVATPPLPGSTVGATYSTTLIRSGGTAPFLWSITAGALPAGLNLNPNSGTISGTPSTTGTANFTALVSDSVGATSATPFSIAVAPAPVITSVALTGGTVNLPYLRTMTSTGGMAPISWSLAAGLLPTGLTLNADTGGIGGTASVVGTFNFTLRVTDSVGVSAVQPLSIVIAATPTITTTSLQSGTAAAAYSTAVANGGGTAPFTWTIVAGSGTLPTGLSLQADTGVISGTPSAAGTFNFTIRVRDSVDAVATQSLSIVIFPPLLVSTAALPDGTSGFAYSTALNNSGGIAPFSWAITLGTLPNGLNLNASTGTISGTPIATGLSNFTVRVSDAAGAITSKALSIAVASPLAITTTSLPSGIASTAYSTTLTATGGATPHSWSVTVGLLPIGLALNSSTGVISGTPASLGTEFFTVQVLDNGNPNRTSVQSLAITIVPAVAISTITMQGATTGIAYSQTLTATGGAPPYTWSVTSGTLPPGLSLEGSSGLISGTPTAQGAFNFTVRATDSVASTPAFRNLSINVDLLTGGVPALALTYASTLPAGTLGYEYSQSLTATGGILPHSYVVLSGTLPFGLTLSSGGVLSGTPQAAGNFSFTVQVRDAATLAQTATKTLSITVVPALSIGTASLPDGIAAVPYAVTLTAVGGAAPYRWSITGGSLPDGFALDPAAGSISGTTVPLGTFNVRITLTDAQSFTSSKQFPFAVLFPQIDGNLPSTVKSAQQPVFSPTLRSSLPNAVSGTLTLSFTPSAAVINGLSEDPMLQFSNGLKTVNFTIPANSTTVVTSPPVILLTGTVAGTIRISANIQDGPANMLVGTTDIVPDTPQITALEAVQSAAGISIRTTGYSNTRSITSVTFTFDVRGTTGTQQVSLTRSVGSDFANWYLGSTAAAFGSSFVFVQSFNVQGNASLIDAVTVTLTNAQGSMVSSRTVLTRQ